MWTHEDTLAYLKGKGKGNRSHSSGKGFGRRKNPRDRNGSLMKCHNCGSEEHLVARCPQKGSGKGGKSRGIDFTAFASPGEGDPADALGDRVFAEPTLAPWGDFAFHYGEAPSYDSFMVNGADDRSGLGPWSQGTDPWLRGPFTGPRPFAPHTVPLQVQDPWVGFRPGVGYRFDDELSAASSHGSPDPTARGSRAPPSVAQGAHPQLQPVQRSMAHLGASRVSFTQSAVASLMRDYAANPADMPYRPTRRDPPEGHPSAEASAPGLLNHFFPQ